MLCKVFIKNLLKKQAFKSTSKLVHSQQHSFINVGMFNQINEQFTDSEMKLQNGFNNFGDELDLHHKGFHEKYLDTYDEVNGNNQQNIHSFASGDLESYSNNHMNYYNHQTQSSMHFNLLTNNSNLNQSVNDISTMKVLRNFYSALSYIESVDSAEQKLRIIQQYCLQNKQNTKERDQKQKEYMLQLIQPVIKSINKNPQSHTPETLYSLLNVARCDFLNFPLTPKVLVEIKKHIQQNYKNFDVDQIKHVFFASCMQSRESSFSIIEPNVFCAWFKKITSKIQSEECTERDLILFLSYNQKDIDLFLKTNKFISHQFTTNKTLIECLNNPELIKVIVSLFCKHEKGNLQLYTLLIKSLYHTLENDLISASQFQIILRNLLRSQLFLSFRIISSFSNCQNLTYKNQEETIDFISESDGEKTETQFDQTQLQQPKLQNELQDLTQQYELNNILSSKKSDLSFKIVDNYVKANIQQLSNNQILNVLNLYQNINAQNYKSTVIELLDQIKKNFSPSCDNFFTFNIMVRSLYLFQIQNPLQYLDLFQSSPQKLSEVLNYQFQIANTFVIVREMFPQYWNSKFDEVYSQLWKDISKNYQKTKLYILKQQQYSIYQKQDQISMIQSILERLSTSYSQQHLIESTHIDFFIKPSNSSESNKLQLPQTPLTIDVVTQIDEMAPGILNGNLTLKGKVFKSLKIPYIILNQEFCQSLKTLDPNQQTQVFIKEIQKQISRQN